MRKTPYLPHPAFTTQEHIDEITRHEIQFVIEPRGPSKFRLKSMETNEKWTVSIGTDQACTCRDTEVCVHIIYVMMRYFGVPNNCDILWQKSLTDHEIDSVLNGRVKQKPPPKPQAIYKTKSGKSKVKRLPIGDEDVCPICYDSLKDCDKSKLSWCRIGCGGNFHRKCVKAWIDSQRSSGKEILCPICRQPLDMLGINPPKKPPPPSNAPPPLTEAEIRDLMNREITPDDYDLLLKLDQCGHCVHNNNNNQFHYQPPKRRTPNPAANNQNQRIQVANRILREVPDLQVTNAAAPRESPSVKPATSNRPVVRRVPPNQNRRQNQNLNPFIAEITGSHLSPEIDPSPNIQLPQHLQPLRQPSRQPQYQPPPQNNNQQQQNQRPSSGRLIITGIGSSLGTNNYNRNNNPINPSPSSLETHLKSPAPWHGGGGGENRVNSKRNIVIPPKRPTHFHQAQGENDSPQFLVSNFQLQ